jgi:hypothetical protein
MEFINLASNNRVEKIVLVNSLPISSTLSKQNLSDIKMNYSMHKVSLENKFLPVGGVDAIIFTFAT